MASLPDASQSLDPGARALYEKMSAQRGGLGPLYRGLFNHPALVERIGALGEMLRFQGCLPPTVRELAILITAREWGVAYEWAKHKEPACKAGLSEQLLDAIRRRQDLTPFDSLYPLVEQVALLVKAHRELPDQLQSALEERLGLRGVIELAALCGFYEFIGAICAAFVITEDPD